MLNKIQSKQRARHHELPKDRQRFCRTPICAEVRSASHTKHTVGRRSLGDRARGLLEPCHNPKVQCTNRRCSHDLFCLRVLSISSRTPCCCLFLQLRYCASLSHCCSASLLTVSQSVSPTVLTCVFGRVRVIQPCSYLSRSYLCCFYLPVLFLHMSLVGASWPLYMGWHTISIWWHAPPPHATDAVRSTKRWPGNM